MASSQASAEKAAIRVFSFFPLESGGVYVPDASPFVHKLLSYLALARVPFVARGVAAKGNPSAPKGKFPYARFPTGKVLGDSQLIIQELERDGTPGDKLDAWLTPPQRALSHLVRRTLEESTYWNSIIQRRWIRKANFYSITVPMYFEGLVPSCLRPLVGWFMRRGMVQAIKGQGMGRHSDEVLLAMGVEDISSIEALFPSPGPFFHGERPSTIDAVLHAFVSALRLQTASYSCEAASPEAELAERCPKLRAHNAHMDALLNSGFREVLAAK